MNTRILFTLALAGLVLPIPSDAANYRQSSRQKQKKYQSNRYNSKSSRRNRASKPAPKTVTPDLPPNLPKATADADIHEAAEYAAVRKMLRLIHEEKWEEALPLFDNVVDLKYRGPVATMDAQPETSGDKEATGEDVLALFYEHGLLKEGYESIQIVHAKRDSKTAIACMLQCGSAKHYAFFTAVYNAETGKIDNVSFNHMPNEADGLPAEQVTFDADALIKMGLSNSIGIVPMTSGTAANSGIAIDWWAPDMEFTTDPLVKEAILGPEIKPFSLIKVLMLDDNYLSFLRQTDMTQMHSQAMSNFAPRVKLIGLDKEVSREELYAMLSNKEFLLPDDARIIASGYKGHCYQFVITYTDALTKKKSYIRTCFVIDAREKIIGVMESKCVNAPPKVNSSFKDGGTSVEYVEDPNALNGQEIVDKFMQTWTSGDDNTWNDMLATNIGTIILPGMSKPAKNVPRADAIELMKQSRPVFMEGGYDIVEIKEDNCLYEATVVFKDPAPNGQKVKATVEINYVKEVANFFISMSYVDSDKKFSQADFIAAVEGIDASEISVADQPIKDLPEDIKGAEVLRRILEAAKTNDEATLINAIKTKHINQLQFPGDASSRISKPADLLKGLRELIPNLDKIGYRIYVHKHSNQHMIGILAINEGKPIGAIDYAVSVMFSYEGSVNGFSITSSTMGSDKKSAGKAKIDVPAPDSGADAPQYQSLCPPDMDFSSLPAVKAAEAAQPSGSTPMPTGQNVQVPIDYMAPGLAELYKIHRLNAANRKDSKMQEFQASLGQSGIFTPQVNVLGESVAVSADELNKRLDSPELLWGKDCTVYKMGIKGKSIQVIYRVGAENADPLYFNTILLSDDIRTIHTVGESLFVNKEPVLAPGYTEPKNPFAR